MSQVTVPQNLNADQGAAHYLLCELRTRISTQPLPYQYGVEARALESLWEIFAQARAAMKKYPGCADFARRTTEMLNMVLRPTTAKWHRAHLEGRLNSRDGANEFRADLADVQVKLRAFAEELQQMAYGNSSQDALTPEPISPAELAQCLADLPFGIIPQHAVTDSTVEDINAAEATAVLLRREKYGLDAEPRNAVGLGLSGGGIRSATFCLGAIQVLADRGLLKDVDFLSTVSGGSGTFLTRTLGRGTPQTDIAGPHGPDPAAIRYVRQHAKYLSAYNLKKRWGMVTTIFAGMVLNWTAPLLVLTLASLAAERRFRHMPTRSYKKRISGRVNDAIDEARNVRRPTARPNYSSILLKPALIGALEPQIGLSSVRPYRRARPVKLPLLPSLSHATVKTSLISMFQIRAVPSSEAVAICAPSGLNTASKTSPPCAFSAARSWPVLASQMRAVSPDAVTMRVPSGLNAADHTV